MSTVKKEPKKNMPRVSLIGGNFKKDGGQGIEKYCAYLSELLLKKRVHIDKVEMGYPKNPAKVLFNGLCISFFRTLFKKSDIYHFITPEAIWPCILKRPSVVTVYDLITYILKNERKKTFNFYFKVMMNFAKRADHIIVISESTKKDVIKFLKVRPNKISRIYLGIDHKQFYPVKNKKRNKTFTVGYVGGLGKRKNVEFILKLAKGFKNDKRIVFKIAGKGPEKVRLEKVAKNWELNNVEFAGFISEEKLNNFYNSLDLFIFPSLYEGFGLPVLEAIACGVPTVVSDRGSLSEVVPNNDFIIDIDDVGKVKKRIESLIKNKKELNKMSKTGISFAEKFSWNKTINKTLKIYQTILK